MAARQAVNSRREREFETKQLRSSDRPSYINKGGLELVGKNGLFRDSERFAIQVRPDDDRALNLSVVW